MIWLPVHPSRGYWWAHEDAKRKSHEDVDAKSAATEDSNAMLLTLTLTLPDPPLRVWLYSGSRNLIGKLLWVHHGRPARVSVRE